MQQTLCLLDLLNSRHSKINFVFRLVSLNCRLRLLEYFSKSFRKKDTAFSYFFLFLVPVQCRRQDSYVKYYVIYYIILFLKTFRHFKMQKEKKLCGDDVTRVSVL